ncbi:MAG TPA: thymidylate kinase [Terriglobales bacterium]|jgi:thymidylate kinase|nr:thymidylate kinase [Terriglobales bacterium]
MHRKPLLITFSGLDGSGKSTQIANLQAVLASWNCTARLITFWDDVVVLTRYRERFVHKVFKSEQGVGAPGKPVNRRDKNMRGWYLTLARHGLYLLDALHLRRVVARARKSGADVLIMDRYIYDELANLPLANSLSRAFARMIAALVPRPNVALLLDANPDEARERKPEYPVEFMRECRSWYHELAALLGTMIIIPPLQLEQAKDAVIRTVAAALSRPVHGSPELEWKETA